MEIQGATGDDLARDSRRRIFLYWVISVVLVVSGSVTYFAFTPWRVRHLYASAVSAQKSGDLPQASVRARRALQLDPTFADACVVLAEICEQEHLPDAVAWRERVVYLTGGTPPSLLAFASAALSFEKTATARSALDRLPESERNGESYLVLEGTLAAKAGDNAAATKFFQAACALNPEYAAHRFALAKAQVASGDYLTRKSGLDLLSELRNDGKLGVQALRTLISNNEDHREFQAAIGATQQLVALPAHEFSDEILLLQLLRMTRSDRFFAALETAQHSAEGNLTNVQTLLGWMSNHGLASDGLAWALQRTPKLGHAPEIRPSIASCHIALGDWKALLAMTQAGAWKPVEYMRHVYRTRALRELGDGPASRAEWALAVTAAARQPESLTWMAQRAAEWSWEDEAEDTLWALLELIPTTPWAIEYLQKQFVARGETAGLRRIALLLLKADPANEDAQNDVALSSLLLNTEVERARTIAEELHTRHPDSATYASTYAFALYRSSKTAAGLQVLEALPPEKLEEPSIAGYYGILLAADKKAEKARHYISIAKRASVLPEEVELLRKAEQAVSVAGK